MIFLAFAYHEITTQIFEWNRDASDTEDNDLLDAHLVSSDGASYEGTTQMFESNRDASDGTEDNDLLDAPLLSSSDEASTQQPPPTTPMTCSLSLNKTASIEQLLNALKTDPEYNGLRDLNVTVEDGSGSSNLVQFEGLTLDLLQKAFFNRTGRVIIGGDSTLAHPYKKLQFLESYPDLISLGNLSQANLAISHAVAEHVNANETINKNATIQQRYHEFIDFRKNRPTGCNSSIYWQQIASRDPEVLVLNMGLHWLHLYAGERRTPICQVKMWLDYEESWLQTIIEKARRLPGLRLLLFKTTNFVCEDMFSGYWKEANQLYNAKDGPTMEECEVRIEKKLPERDKRQIKSFCYNGTLNGRGAAHLNSRLNKFVQNLQPEVFQVEVWNDHDVESCEYTTAHDGRHYHILQLVRLRYLANVILCYLGDDA